MGYDLYITRKESWRDDMADGDISLAEWNQYITDDPEMRLNSFTEITLPDGEVLKIEQVGLAVWEKYSGGGASGTQVWFWYLEGNISVKNPDKEIVDKMLAIADKLNARVQGDEEEPYDQEDLDE